MIVVDSSAIVHVLVSRPRDSSLVALIRYPHDRLLDRIWELRDNLTAYDAAFVALGEALGVPVVTTDRRLASAAGHDAVVEAYG